MGPAAQESRYTVTFTAKQIQILLDALAHKYGRGYSDDKEVSALQAKLSIMLEVKNR